LGKFNRFLNIPFFLFTTGYLDPCQFNQHFPFPLRIENFGNANKVKMPCQGFGPLFLLLLFLTINL
jgi:hypothetical protein